MPDQDTSELWRRLGAVEAELSSRRASRPGYIEIGTKLLIPIAVAFLAFATDCASRRTAEGQLALAKAIEDRQAADAAEARQLKYVELFYQDISDPTPAKQMTAASLLSVLKPEYSRPLLRVIQTNPAVTPAVRQHALGLVAVSARFGALINYRLAFFFPEADAASVSAATSVQATLLRERFPGEISMRPSSGAGIEALGAPIGNEIRYDRHYEDDAARELQQILKTYLPNAPFTLVPTDYGRTDNYMSVFFSTRR
jgi:hypothetical protein